MRIVSAKTVGFIEGIPDGVTSGGNVLLEVTTDDEARTVYFVKMNGRDLREGIVRASMEGSVYVSVMTKVEPA
jgi:hypothetical protein